jgi:tetratricopeptide (TPR) repeat protein
MNFKTFILILLFSVSFLGVNAQVEKVMEALDLFQQGSLMQAKNLIDEAVVEKEAAAETYSWYAKGFIYKEIYKVNERNNPTSQLREESVKAFIKSIELDKEKEHIEANQGNLKFLWNSYYNDAVVRLKAGDYRVATDNFNNYCKISELINETASLKAKEIEFNLALATVFTSIYESNRKQNEIYFNKIRDAYLKVLNLDHNNTLANYNLGILYYNKAVHIINELDLDTDIFVLMEVQENTVDIFKQSLPYMEKAYQLEPAKKETLKGLEGIYFSLNEFEKSSEIKAKLESLD